MTERMLHQFAEPDAASLDMLRMAMERLKLSARAYSRILKVARTIADLEGSEKVQSQLSPRPWGIEILIVRLSALRPGAKYRDWNDAFFWLKDAGCQWQQSVFLQ